MKSLILSICFLPGMLTALLSFTSCEKENYTYAPSNTDTTTAPVIPVLKDSATRNYLALGDSYTIGQSVSTADRFPAQTVQLLRQSGIKINDPVYIATTGWTTRNLINSINYEHPASDYDVVSLLIGVNDQYQGLDTAGYRVRFTELLNTSISLAAGRRNRVFVLSIPDYSATPFVSASEKARVSAEVDRFNAINKQVTLQNNIVYIDITPSSREAAINPAMVAGDGLHPSGLEYKKWAAMLAPAMKQVLQ